MAHPSETVQRLRDALHSLAAPASIAPDLRGWWTPDGWFVCAQCAGRIFARGMVLPKGSEAIWGKSDRVGSCCTCDLRTPTPEQREQQAAERGGDAGRTRALDGGEQGGWLSGEWAGESIPELLGDLLDGVEGDEYQTILDLYEEAADREYARTMESFP